MEQTMCNDIKDVMERRQVLMDSCDKVEERSYMKHFAPDEILAMKEVLADLSIRSSDLDMERKQIMDEFKERAKPINDELAKVLGNIRQKAEMVNEQCYKFVDIENKMVGYYNGEGLLVDSRVAMSDELQGTIFQINRTGTEG